MRFNIGFEEKEVKKLHAYWDEIIVTKKWSEGKFVQMFEEKWEKYNQLYSVAFASWTGAALATLEFFNIKEKTILCPANTFMATPLTVIKAGGNIEFVDCNKDDLCLSFEDLKIKIEKYRPYAVWVVHIGGHIAFQIEEIAKYCQDKGILLFEDCAHAHGATWKGNKPGSWADAGIYSFYATKTITTGEGGMLVTKHKALTEFAKQYRNYGKFDYRVEGLNYRMNEFTAAIGCVQVDNLDEIVNWKNEYAHRYLDAKFTNRLEFPDGMTSGYYKYIVFDPIEKSTGKVYERPCHKILGRDYRLPNSEWVSENHWCVPLYYKGGEL